MNKDVLTEAQEIYKQQKWNEAVAEEVLRLYSLDQRSFKQRLLDALPFTFERKKK